MSLNLYVYCVNNPIVFIDPSGHRSLRETWNLFKKLVYGAIEVGYGFQVERTFADMFSYEVGLKMYDEFGLYQGEFYKESNFFVGAKASIISGFIEVGAVYESSVGLDIGEESPAYVFNPERKYEGDIYFKVGNKVFSVYNAIIGEDFVEEEEQIVLNGGSVYGLMGIGAEIGFSDSVMKELLYYSESSSMPVIEPIQGGTPIGTPAPTINGPNSSIKPGGGLTHTGINIRTY